MRNLLKSGILLLLGILALSVTACKKEEDDDSGMPAAKPVPEKTVVTKTVTFIVDKKIYKTQTVEENKTVVKPEHPKKDGFYFIGWYTSSDNGEHLATRKYDFNTAITQDLKLYAKWSEFELLRGNAISVVLTIPELTKSRYVCIEGKLSPELLKDIATEIKDKSFEFSLDLTETTGLERIEESSFSVCKNLSFINMPSGITSIGKYAFADCTGLTTMNIPDGVTSIGEHAFGHCRNLTMITIPNSVTSIGEFAFSTCTSLTTINIPDSVTSIGEYTFTGCSSLTTISIPSTVTSISFSSFLDCTSLTTINIPDSVTSIESQAFNNCRSLTTINIPSSVTKIGKSVFVKCTNLASITFAGTKVQWNAIIFGESWNGNAPATVVHCSDGDVTL